MLWDLIRDFYVEHIFGGYSYSTGQYVEAFMGSDLEGDYWLTDGFRVAFPGDQFLSLGDYLSTLCTIITLIAILLFCVFIIKKIIAIIFRLFTGSSAF